MNSKTVLSNTASSIYAKIAKTAVFTALAAVAMVAATTAQARQHYYQDVQYVQGGAQLVITRLYKTRRCATSTGLLHPYVYSWSHLLHQRLPVFKWLPVPWALEEAPSWTP
jgi:hypothetical protein